MCAGSTKCQKCSIGKISNMPRRSRRKSQTSTIVATGVGVLAGVLASKLINRVPVVGTNVFLSAGTKVVAGVVTGMVGGKSLMPVAAGMVASGGKDIVTNFIPSIGKVSLISGPGFKSAQVAKAPNKSIVRTL